MLKIAVIGGADTVLGFKALGLECCEAANAEEARAALRKLTEVEGQYAIIYMEEGLAAALPSEIDRFKENPVPAIIVIPGRDGSMGMGLSALNAAVEKAVGTNILN